jgi:hypothetical protein
VLPADRGHGLLGLELARLQAGVDGLLHVAAGRDLGPREGGDHGLGTVEGELDGFHHGAAHIQADDALFSVEHRWDPCFLTRWRSGVSQGNPFATHPGPRSGSAEKRAGV